MNVEVLYNNEATFLCTLTFLTFYLYDWDYTEFQSENPKEINHLEDLGRDGGIILKWILKEISWECVVKINVVQDGEDK
jgi:hypothetical protein